MMRYLPPFFGAALALWFFPVALPAYGAGPIVLDDPARRIVIGRNIEYCVDRSKRLTIQDILHDAEAEASTIRWLASAKKYPSFGFSQAVYWVRFTVRDPARGRLAWTLVLDYPHIDDVRLYSVRGARVLAEQREGDMLPFDRRDMAYRNFVFNLRHLAGGDMTYYLRVETTSTVALPLMILSAPEISRKVANEQLVLGLYYGLIILIAFYNLFIFFSIRDMSYLYYFTWIIGYGLYQITLNGLSFQYFWPDSVRWANMCLPFFIFFGASWALQFGRSFLHTADNAPVMDRVILGIMAVTALGAVLAFIVPYRFIIRAGTFMVMVVTLALLTAGVYSLVNGFRAARFYVFAWSTLLVGITVYALKTFGILPENFFTEWSQQIGSALEVSLLSLALADRINMINRERRIAQDERMKAQEKYRLLFEGADEMIFTLDENWNFTSVNNAVDRHLRRPPRDLIGKNFLDLVFVGDDADTVTRKLAREKLAIFSSGRAPVSFKTQFATFNNLEPKDIHVRLEFVSIGGKDEILGKAASVQEDVLMRYFECERQRFRIGNYFSTAEDVSYRVTRNLTKFMEQREINVLRIALREMIINAIEHGNLCITFDEKTRALSEDSYFDMLARRQKDPVYGSRTVEIFYSIDAEKVVFRITDEGSGFNFSTLLEGESDSANEMMMSHGRGISMSRGYFDEIQYNRQGNQVLLVKRFA